VREEEGCIVRTAYFFDTVKGKGNRTTKDDVSPQREAARVRVD